MQDFVTTFSVGTSKDSFWLGLVKIEGVWQWADGSSPGPEDDDIV